MSGVTLGSILAAIGIFVTFFFVPSQLRGYFILLAALGMMAGYYTGYRTLGKGQKSNVVPLWLPIVLALVCFVSATAYQVKINEVSSDRSDIIIDGLLFMVFFFSLAFFAKVIGVKLVLSERLKARLLSILRLDGN